MKNLISFIMILSVSALCFTACGKDASEGEGNDEYKNSA